MGKEEALKRKQEVEELLAEGRAKKSNSEAWTEAIRVHSRQIFIEEGGRELL